MDGFRLREPTVRVTMPSEPAERLGWLRRMAGAVKHLLTAKDGETYTPARVYWCLAALTQIGLSIWHTAVLGQAFSSTDFGTGMGLVLTAGGLGVWITRKSEPDD